MYASVNPGSFGSDNGMSPIRRQAIIWTNTGLLLIIPLGKHSVKYWSKFKHFHRIKYIWKSRLLCRSFGLDPRVVSAPQNQERPLYTFQISPDGFMWIGESQGNNGASEVIPKDKGKVDRQQTMMIFLWMCCNWYRIVHSTWLKCHSNGMPCHA